MHRVPASGPSPRSVAFTRPAACRKCPVTRYSRVRIAKLWRSRWGVTCGKRGSAVARIRSEARSKTVGQAVNGPPPERTASRHEPPSGATSRRRSAGVSVSHFRRTSLTRPPRASGSVTSSGSPQPRRSGRQPDDPSTVADSVDLQVVMHGRQGVAGDPGRTELAALRDRGRDRERDRHLHPAGRQRRDLPGQQRAELLQSQPGRQRQFPDRGVAGQLTAPVTRVRRSRRVPGPRSASRNRLVKSGSRYLIVTCGFGVRRTARFTRTSRPVPANSARAVR